MPSTQAVHLHVHRKRHTCLSVIAYLRHQVIGASSSVSVSPQLLAQFPPLQVRSLLHALHRSEPLQTTQVRFADAVLLLPHRRGTPQARLLLFLGGPQDRCGVVFERSRRVGLRGRAEAADRSRPRKVLLVEPAWAVHSAAWLLLPRSVPHHRLHVLGMIVLVFGAPVATYSIASVCKSSVAASRPYNPVVTISSAEFIAPIAVFVFLELFFLVFAFIALFCLPCLAVKL